MITVEDLAIDVGARRLMSEVSFRVHPGDKVGLVGRNGAGKTTLTRTLSGELQPAEGHVRVSGELGFLPQDPRSGDPEQLARHRILDARGLGTLTRDIARASEEMASDDPRVAEKAMRRFGNLTDRILPGRGYVVDFLDFQPPFYELIDKTSGGHFPSFNIADSCICIAAGLLILSAFRQPDSSKKKKKAAAFGCYGWSGESVKILNEMLADAGFEIIGEGMRQLWNPDDAAKKAAVELGRTIAK